ncbi:MAG: enolase C-terminal domain-like protein [Candidatus Micrarchaeota archaeon]|nr:enolase C-terminal domain-like protein [Candidatus Micrarchaeota archaeon]
MNLTAFQALDSRGVPTICAVLKIKNGTFTATVPSGTTTGKNEAVELRDGGKSFNGKGVSKAVQNVQDIAKKLPKDYSQDAVDNFLISLDATENKSKLGANTTLAISLVIAKANAAENNEPLFSYFSKLSRQTAKIPLPMACIASGDKHSGKCVSIQEFMLLPVKFSTFSACTQAIAEIYYELGKLTAKKTKEALFTDMEGGIVLPFTKAQPTLELITNAIDRAGYSGKVKLALDCAASEFYNEKTKIYNYEGRKLSSDKLSGVYFDLMRDFSIVSIEDPFHEEDFAAFAEFTKKTKPNITVVGDDLLTTNSTRITRAVLQGSCNALLLKPNQIGTVTETLEAAEMARNAGWKVIASHRSGDSEDPFLADLATGLACDAAKIGGPSRGERTAKYNRLLYLEKFHKLKLAKWNG